MTAAASSFVGSTTEPEEPAARRAVVARWRSQAHDQEREVAAQVLAAAEEYVDAWWRGVARGPDAAAEALSELVDHTMLVLVPDGVCQRKGVQGYDALMAALAVQHAEYHKVQYRPVASATAAPSSPSAYVLGEYRMQDVGGLAGHPATFRVSRGYCLYKLQLGPGGRITRGWVRRQMTQEERDERVWDPVHVYPAPFPLDRLHLTRDGTPNPAAMEAAARAWVAAHAMPPPPPPPPPQTTTAAAVSGNEEKAATAAAGSGGQQLGQQSEQEAKVGELAAGAGDGSGSEGLSDEERVVEAAAEAAVEEMGRMQQQDREGEKTEKEEQQDGAAADGDGAPARVPSAEQERLMQGMLAVDCRLMDAYGVWLDPEDLYGSAVHPTYGGTYGGRRPTAVVGAKRIVHRLMAHQQQCSSVEPHLVDVAVSEEHNLAFVHWVNTVTPAAAPPPSPPPPPPAASSGSKPKASKQQQPGGATAAEVVGASTAILQQPQEQQERKQQQEPRQQQPIGERSSPAATAATAAAAAATAATAASAAAAAAGAAASVATTAASVAADAANSAAAEHERREPHHQQATEGSGLEQGPQGQEQGQVQQVRADGGGAASGGSWAQELQAAIGQAAGQVTAAVSGGARSGSPGGGKPLLPPIPQLPLQNLEEALTVAAHKVYGAAGTAAAAASAAAAAATAVIMAEQGGVPADGQALAAAAAAAVAAKRREAAQQPAPAAPAPVQQLPYKQDCMAALLFNEDGTVSDVWLFRGPYHYEKHLLRR